MVKPNDLLVVFESVTELLFVSPGPRFGGEIKLIYSEKEVHPPRVEPNHHWRITVLLFGVSSDTSGTN